MVHRKKEIENLLLLPSAMDRAAQNRLKDRGQRLEKSFTFKPCAQGVLERFAESRRSYVTAQYLAERRKFERKNSPGINEAAITEAALDEVSALWEMSRFDLIPGKEALSVFNSHLQSDYAVSVTPTTIIDAMHIADVPLEMTLLVELLQGFSASRPPN